ncbi:SPOR domain-containing protein [Parapedobacter deserti]|uniref:SPOR domain-containing protein n=1 Tax=Parapedobacter deserti TaxID=1912957 RepID=A0ABV7JFS9_9SPHI
MSNMNLGLCIANLLKRYPAVEVPGIGVFKVTRIPACYDEDQKVYLPPASYVELTGEESGVFPITTYLQAQAGVDEPTAEQMLETALVEIMEAISRNGRAVLDGLGYLLADGASFIFRPFEIEGLERKPAKARLFGRKGDAAPPMVVEDAQDATADTRGDEVDEMQLGRRRPIGWVAAAVLLVSLSALGIAWYVKPDWFDRAKIAQFLGQKKEVKDSSDGMVPTEPVNSRIGTVTDSITVDTVAQQVTAMADSIRLDSMATAMEQRKPSVTYEIIVGSFATMAQAKKYVTEMKAKGYDLQAIDSRMPGNRKKISWGSFTTEEEAYRELARVQKTFEPGAWIAKVEHD